MLKVGLEVGQTHHVQKRVQYEDSSVSFGRKGIETLFSTTAMVQLMIQAAVELVGEKIPEDYISVTQKMEFIHLSPTLQGAFVTARAELVDMDSNVLKFKITCHDELGKIAEATQTRHIVNKQVLINRAHKRAEMLEDRIQ
jgi:fluoroacetyl-CoA thioesterase